MPKALGSSELRRPNGRGADARGAESDDGIRRRLPSRQHAGRAGPCRARGGELGAATIGQLGAGAAPAGRAAVTQPGTEPAWATPADGGADRADGSR